MPVPPKDPNPAASQSGNPITGTDYNDLIDLLIDNTLGHAHSGSNTDGRQINHSDLLGVSSDQHHSEAHKFVSGSGHTNTRSGNVTISIPAGFTTAASAVTFSPPFSSLPEVITWARNNIPPFNIQQIIIPIALPISGSIIWPAFPSYNEFLNTDIHRLYIDSTGYTDIKFVFDYRGAGEISPVGIGIEYSGDLGGTWTRIGSTYQEIDATGYKDSNWISLPTAAKANQILFRVFGSGSDGNIDELFGPLWIWFRTSGRTLITRRGIPTTGSVSIVIDILSPQIAATNISVGWFAFIP